VCHYSSSSFARLPGPQDLRELVISITRAPESRSMTVDVYDGRCALKIIASQVRKSRAHTPSRTSHMPLAHRIHLLFIAQKPRFALGGVFRLGLDRARSRGFTVMVFILFRGSFEAVFLLFCSSEGPRDYPRPDHFHPFPAFRDPPEAL